MTANEQKARDLALESVFCLLASLPLSVIVYAGFEDSNSFFLGPMLLPFGWRMDVSYWFLLPRCVFVFGIWCGLRALFVSEPPRSGVVRIASILGAVLAMLLIVAKILELPFSY